ncbi:hypothetical protein D9B85_12850 [Corynebacterium diphtheriae]|nr:hypothetical protein D9B85_12850 [Corynebacterium diphtheriae]
MTTTAPTEADLIRQAKNMPAEWQNLGYHELNAMLNLYGADGRIQFEEVPQRPGEPSLDSGCDRVREHQLP